MMLHNHPISMGRIFARKRGGILMAQQPTGQQVFIDQATYNALLQQGLITPGQPTQQIFQQPTPQPPPASTMQAMAQQGQWTQQGNPAVVNPAQQQHHAQAMPQQQPQFAPQMAAAQPQQQAPTSPQLQQQVGQFMEQLKEGMMEMLGNGQQGQQQQNGQQNQPPFFDTTMGKVVIGTGGIGIGVVGTKLVSSIFGESSKCGVSANDANAFVNAFKTLLR